MKAQKYVSRCRVDKAREELGKQRRSNLSRELDSVKRGNLRSRENGAVALALRMVFGQ